MRQLMRNSITALVLTSALVGPPLATATDGWAWHGNTWVRYSFHVPHPDRLTGRALAVTLSSKREAAMQKAFRRRDARLLQARRLLARAQQVLANARNTIATVKASCTSGPVHDLIVRIFGPAAPAALAVASRESGCFAGAHNPSGASGVFQLMKFWWDGSSSFGWVFDPFDAYENVSHAKLIYDYEGGWCPAWC